MRREEQGILSDFEWTYPKWLILLVVEKQDVTPLKRGLHGTRQHHHNWTLAVSEEHQELPDHQRRQNHHAQVQRLEQQLPLVGPEVPQRLHLLPHSLHLGVDALAFGASKTKETTNCLAGCESEGRDSNFLH